MLAAQTAEGDLLPQIPTGIRETTPFSLGILERSAYAVLARPALSSRLRVALPSSPQIPTESPRKNDVLPWIREESLVKTAASHGALENP